MDRGEPDGGATVKIVKTSQVEWADAMKKGRFGQRRKELGGDKLRCGLWELAPGKASFPLHRHLATEEAMFVISGKAKIRTNEGETPVTAGDYVSFPPGGVAHQVLNDSAEPLVYLGMSAGVGVDVVEYPDSGKVASAVGSPSSGKRFVFMESTQVDYWKGEE
jgi:uncharacterized cupin superfamily protein